MNSERYLGESFLGGQARDDCNLGFRVEQGAEEKQKYLGDVLKVHGVTRACWCYRGKMKKLGKHLEFSLKQLDRS